MAETHQIITKVWIAPGCIVCDACENDCPEVFDVALQVQSVVELLRPLMGAGVHLQLEHPQSASWLARADISQFETALVNLAVNARDAMQAKGTLTITIALHASAPATGTAPSSAHLLVAISVRDSGCGIAAEQLKAIFEPFYTPKAPGKGTGLGLSQVLGFARQSGGDVQVHSAPSQGTVFTLCLPLAQP